MENIIFGYEQIKTIYNEKPNYKMLMSNIDYYIKFLNSFYYFTNNFYTITTSFKKTFNINKENDTFKQHLENIDRLQNLDLGHLIKNSANTLYSFKKCIEIINLSDGLTLLRKFKDDFFLFVYFLRLGTSNEEDYNTEQKLNEWNKFCNDAFKWSNNQMKGVYYSTSICLLKRDKNLVQLDKELQIFKFFKDYTKDLNNYAHSNGLTYINHPNPLNNIEFMEKRLEYINIQLDKIFSYLFTIIFYIRPDYLMSSDYIDYMEAGERPPENSQYWIAPIYQKFIDDKISKVNLKLKKFLINNTPMHIN